MNLRYLVLNLLLLLLQPSINAQYEWQNALDFKAIDLGDKYALAYNIGGVLLSNWLGRKKEYTCYWETAFYAEYHQEYDVNTSTTDVFMGKARLGRQLQRWLQVGGETQLFKFKNAEVSTAGLGGAVYFNWYLLNRPRFQLYFDNGFGIIGTTKNFPVGGTAFNFSNFYGLSSNFKIRPDAAVKIGVRNMHLSNAFLFGDDRNPAFDSIGFLIGFTFK